MPYSLGEVSIPLLTIANRPIVVVHFALDDTDGQKAIRLSQVFCAWPDSREIMEQNMPSRTRDVRRSGANFAWRYQHEKKDSRLYGHGCFDGRHQPDCLRAKPARAGCYSAR